ncbi:MAG: hypothetical protein C0631_07940 [Sedimenticola sp.]|nr:MAG: hypothetical protein C0631_07940 [Sedimenticola sp.]
MHHFTSGTDAGGLNQYFKKLSRLWSLSRYGQSELSAYAEQLLYLDARSGVILLCSVTFLLLGSSALLYALLGFDQIYIYTSGLLGFLALHLAISARTVNDTKVLYLLGITLIVIVGVAFVLLAHHSQGFTAELFSSVVLLFLLLPLVPWGLREALIIVLLIYLVFTLSTLTVEGRFSNQTLWTLQFVMVGSALTSLTVIARSILVRKHDVLTRFELEKARHRMELLSLKDPLTGAWNRRFLEQRFPEFLEKYREQQQPFHFALIDIDNFKRINDTQGHDYGDLVLKRLVANLVTRFSGGEHLVRVGGDEFALMCDCDPPTVLLQRVSEALKTDPELFGASADIQVSISAGIATFEPQDDISLETIYREADKALYRAKARGDGSRRDSGYEHVLHQA